MPKKVPLSSPMQTDGYGGSAPISIPDKFTPQASQLGANPLGWRGVNKIPGSSLGGRFPFALDETRPPDATFFRLKSVLRIPCATLVGVVRCLSDHSQGEQKTCSAPTVPTLQVLATTAQGDFT